MAIPLDIITPTPITAGTTSVTERTQVEIADDNATLKIKQQSYAEGLGWFTQKTLSLNIAEAPELLHQLEQVVIAAKMARTQPIRNTAPRGDNESKLLEFPATRHPATARDEYRAADQPSNKDKGKLLTFPTR